MTAAPLTPVLELRDVTRVYEGAGRVVAVRDATISIGRRDVVALVGPSGSGKSTLLNLAGFLDVPSSGERWLEGHRIDNAPDTLERIRRERIGFVFQQFNLIPVMSALENVELGCFAWGTPRTRRERARAMLDAVGLSARERHRPGELSGGEQQRVALARALAKEPAIVIADEPTASLDSTNARAVAELILDTNRTLGTAFLIASHDDRLCAHLPRRIEMRDGVPGVNRELVDVCVA
ncbi:TPA: ABC transporter ATP-binding protein [Burkholderia cepacia ATCC 25416]|uniref:ABC transporter ATP-binding protein n=1 Tax=Burkholderia cepacia TaxID=292 RepID=UPI001CF1AF02|nr:ABC transporter ATP-binding protein [Burkholderia cepacia]HDR9764988.1 ABC transporter ATP-binding protein [Burkholderia cepacia ATCC 25416]MCA8076611.1 ABC transporter ATP-binding protein [Burkholderia cepacia]HDR9776578.1 ABC transporter ATP-binding protein [Burkholderia cepacia ATCC 25416]HDR9780426.1 ABC transporter ATP-binding protein [Burkholderia cepacia ATCC 25416]HDR9788153.1 ABC transporter ATP-binding protein [Burkholderia cepacia ATCC 25416]